MPNLSKENNSNTTVPPIYGSDYVNPKAGRKQRWQFLKDTYWGTGGYTSGKYLIPYKREILKDFDIRKLKSRYTNDYRAIINGHITPIFRGSPQRNYSESLTEQQKTAVDLFNKDCDGAGNSYQSFLKKTARAAKQYDSAFVLIDNAPTTNVMTQADLTDRDNLPYVFLIQPDRISEIKMNERGEVIYIKWITYQDTTPENQSTSLRELVTSDGNGNIKVTVEWDSDFIYRTIEGVSNTETLPNELGYIPVFPLYPDGNEDPVEDPLPKGLAWNLSCIQYRIFNQASVIDNQSDDQAFSILTVPNAQDTDLTNGVNNAIFYNPIEGGGNQSPDFISPDADQLQTLEKIMKDTIDDMYRVGVMPHLRTFAESAESKILNSERTYEVLQDFKDEIMALDNKIMTTFGLYLGLDLGYSAIYPESFGITNLDQDILLFETLDQATTPAPPSVISAIVKRLVSTSFKGMIDEDREDLLELVDSHYRTIEENGVFNEIEPEGENPRQNNTNNTTANRRNPRN